LRSADRLRDFSAQARPSSFGRSLSRAPSVFFLAAGFSTLAAPFVRQLAGGNVVAGTILSAVVGGVASVLGGGKFINGAITGAFAYLATEMALRASQPALNIYGNETVMEANYIPPEERQRFFDEAIAELRNAGLVIAADKIKCLRNRRKGHSGQRDLDLRVLHN
jgi:hypothetical protein